MDEPFTGLDPINAALLKEAFLEMKNRGKTLIFSTTRWRRSRSYAKRSPSSTAAGSLLAETSATCAARPVGRWCGSPWRAILRSTGSRRSTRCVTRRGQDYVEAEVAKGFDPELVLQAALTRRCKILRFEIADPSLEEIFIEHVGQMDTSERTLAPRAVHA